jgi:hypothetical protein
MQRQADSGITRLSFASLCDSKYKLAIANELRDLRKYVVVLRKIFGERLAAPENRRIRTKIELLTGDGHWSRLGRRIKN